jgi:cell cycle checkpoint protein
VPRRSQKFFKPEFFEVLKREREGADGVGDVRRWLSDVGVGDGVGVGVGGWSRAEVAMELGGVLKMRDRLPSSQGKVMLSAALFVYLF